MKKKKIVALLPMKANSDRVKGKNFREFNGKPLFRWTLDTLIAVKDIDQIIINTDAREILEENDLIESNRIVIRDRKKEICGDRKTGMCECWLTSILLMMQEIGFQ